MVTASEDSTIGLAAVGENETPSLVIDNGDDKPVVVLPLDVVEMLVHAYGHFCLPGEGEEYQ